MDKKTLLISIDPGYDSYKIAFELGSCASVHAFPSTIIQETGHHEGLGKKSGNFYLYAEDGRIYLFGEAAENAMRTSRSVEANEELLTLNKGLERFQSSYFKHSLQAALAYSMYLFEHSSKGERSGFKIENLDSYDIYIGVALPHSLLSRDLPKFAEYLLCKHNFKYQVAGEMETPELFDVDLSDAKILGNSQAICAYLNYSLDADLNDDVDPDSTLPCIVDDAGYKTDGRFLLDDNLDIFDAESNTDYAMYNVYQAVADRINKLLPDKHFQPFRVGKYLQANKTVNGNGQVIDIRPIYEEELINNHKLACDNLKEKWSKNLDDCQLYLLAGGTGAAKYEYFKNFMKENYPGIKVVLSNKPYRGEKMEPIFAIALGMLKYLKLRIQE